MNADQEDEIVNAAAEAAMRQLTAGGKPVEAVVTVVLYEGGRTFHISTVLAKVPEDEDRAEGGVLMAASELLDDYVHERGLCNKCNEEKGTAH